MALDATTLAADAYTRLTSDPRNGYCSPLSPAQQDMVRAFCEAIAEAVVDHIVANAVVTVPGPGVSGPGTIS